MDDPDAEEETKQPDHGGALRIQRHHAALGGLDRALLGTRAKLLDLDAALNGSRAKSEVGVKNPALLGDRLFALQLALRDTTRGPVASHFETLGIIEEGLADLRARAEAMREELTLLGRQLVQAGAPWIEGAPLPPARDR